MIRFIFSLMSLAVLASLLGTSVQALKVSPGTWQASIGSNDTADGKFELVNDSSYTATVRIEALAPWLKPERANVSLKAGQKQQIGFKVKFSGPAPAGESFGRIQCADQKGSAGSLDVLLTVKGTERFSAKVTNYSVRLEKDWLQASVSVQNDGNVRFQPAGEIQFMDSKRVIKGTAPVSAQTPVLPGQVRTYFASQRIEAWPNGPYRAHLKLHAANNVIEQDFYFRYSTKKGLEPIPESKGSKIWR